MPEDTLYLRFSKNLYKVQGSFVNTDIGETQISAFSINEFSALEPTTFETLGSGSYSGDLEIDGGYIQSGNFITGVSGWKLDSNGDFEGNSGTFRGSLIAGSIDIPDTVTANSFHADSSGNTWWGATSLASSTASITSAGIASFIGMTSLNLKAYTSFEASGRFISTSGGTGSSTFGNQGMTIATGATGTSYNRVLWWITNFVYNNNPSFVTSMLILAKGSGDARAFIGLGSPTIDGTSIAATGTNHAGFRFLKNSGTLSVEATQCDGSGSRDNASIAALSNLSDNDSLELFMKMTSTSIKYYYRLNGGTLTLGATLSSTMPSGSETYISFMVTNTGSANDCQLQMQCAAYEH